MFWEELLLSRLASSPGPELGEYQMNVRFFALLMVVATAASAGIGTATAAPLQVDAGNASVDVEVGDDSGSSNESTIPEECTEEVDRATVICSSTLDDGTAVLKIWSFRSQSVTLYDAGAFIEGGEVTEGNFRLLPDRVNRVELDVTVTDGGFAGVSIGTRYLTYAEPIEKPKPGFLPGSPQSEDPAIAALTMFLLFGCAFPASYVGLKRYAGGVTDEL